jgi:hypothetical protein
MQKAIMGGLALLWLGGNCVAQSAGSNATTVAPVTSTDSKKAVHTKTRKTTETATASGKTGVITNEKPTTSKIAFQSRPSGARIALSNGRSCVTPCSFIVGYNEKFTGVATKIGYARQELDVSPSVTPGGKAYIVGMAVGAGIIGLAVGAASAPRAYGPEPIVVEMVPTTASGAGMPMQKASYTDRIPR